jgi:hypothetical protein
MRVVDDAAEDADYHCLMKISNPIRPQPYPKNRVRILKFNYIKQNYTVPDLGKLGVVE